MTDKRSLAEIASRQQMDWDRYAGSLRREVAKLNSAHPSLGVVSMCCDHISMLLDEIDLLRADIRRAYGIANEYLNETIELRGAVGVNLERLRSSAESADRGEGTSLRGLSREERREVLASVDTLPKGQDAKQGLAGTEGSAVANGETPTPSSAQPGDA